MRRRSFLVIVVNHLLRDYTDAGMRDRGVLSTSSIYFNSTAGECSSGSRIPSSGKRVLKSARRMMHDHDNVIAVYKCHRARCYLPRGLIVFVWVDSTESGWRWVEHFARRRESTQNANKKKCITEPLSGNDDRWRRHFRMLPLLNAC